MSVQIMPLPTPIHSRNYSPSSMPSASPTAVPYLPTELVLEIFRLGATDTPTAVNLLQLSSWTREFLQPSLYDTVLLNTWSRVDLFRLALNHEAKGQLRRQSGTDFVKKLSIDVGEYPIKDILNDCRRLRSLVVSTHPFHDAHRSLNISPSCTHLTVTGPSYLFRSAPPSITHLTFTQDAPLIQRISDGVIAPLPKLSHLAFRIQAHPLPFAPDPSPRLIDAVNAFLENPTMEVIFVSVSEDADPRFWHALSEIKDHRVVARRGGDWWEMKKWAMPNGDEAFWSSAEREVARRREEL
ncbi:hypothetical protein SISSUDRAFT_840982 [Sistotremastrum suecicum HHB10207 ss-3]|uniref:F-box domain-containing protein n=1 Tax=Sistotremastrum suecicum HHB10207 ss-3 TaxID=1314776 RepID=A0A166CJF8_9AGAM|nr:hypothetical protein SISSUDRAFT_840982 [Sistotremastrum suecicum HHB10207 ss-3]